MAVFPFFKQLDSMDCGPSCIRMVAKHYGKSFSLQALRSRAFITKSGVSMLGISDAAESIGFRTRGYRLTWEQLRDEVPLPCIVHWNQRHFVVVYDIKKGRRARGMGMVCVLLLNPLPGGELLWQWKQKFLISSFFRDAKSSL